MRLVVEFLDPKNSLIQNERYSLSRIKLELVPKQSNVETTTNLTRLELLESLQIAKCDLICRNYSI